MTLAVSGQVSATEVLAEARRLFGELPRGGRVVEPARPTPANPGTRRVIEQAAQQAQILAGGIAPSMSHPDHAAVKVLSTILGGGMAGRLFVELRGRRGLGYAASACYDPVRRSGRADPLSGNRARQRDEGRGGAAPRDRPDSNRPRRRRGAPPRERISAGANERLA
jgi:predicted Zn-dependent peptidase